ncbi:acyl carrier protein [Burkholderia sp. D-99]|uniref:acyl carrier protein n=1 Tax=unclassified Burkholderia TaxID=2613784 RepID=UPI001420BB19|nr:acyl carrier protein [Burkholderia sp. D-99]NHV28511.1 acyl carrier protein [Burkholderia sp. D-99]
MQISERLINVFSAVTQRDVTLDSLRDKNLIETLGLNSVDALEVLIRVEGEFGIQIDDEDLSIDLVSSVDTLEQYIRNRLPAATA